MRHGFAHVPKKVEELHRCHHHEQDFWVYSRVCLVVFEVDENFEVTQRRKYEC